MSTGADRTAEALEGASADPLTAPAPAANAFGSLGRHSLVYAAGLLFNRLVAFLMLPVYTHYLTPADFGTLQLLMLTMDVFALAAGARLAGGVFYYHARAESPVAKHQLLSTALLLLGASYAVISLAIAAAAVPIAGAVFHTAARATLLRLAAAAFFFEGLILVGLTALQARGEPRRYVSMTSSRLLLQVGLNLVMLVGLRRGIEGMMLATVIANAIVATWLTVTILRAVGASVSIESARNLVRFGVPLIGTQVATMVATYGDRYVLNAKAGPDAVGIYSLGLQFGVLVFSLGFVPFNQVWEPRRFDLARQPDRDAVYARAFRLCNLLLITMGLGAVLFVDDYLRLVSAPAFRAAAAVVPVVVVAYVLQAWSDFQNLGIMMRERTALIAWANWACAAAAWLGYLLLVPRFGAIGAGIGLALAFLVRQQLQLAFSQRLWPIRYDWTPILRQLAYAGLAWALAAALPLASVPAALAFHALLFVGYAAGVLWGGVLGAADRADLLRAMTTVRGWVRRYRLGGA